MIDPIQYIERRRREIQSGSWNPTKEEKASARKIIESGEFRKFDNSLHGTSHLAEAIEIVSDILSLPLIHDDQQSRDGLKQEFFALLSDVSE